MQHYINTNASIQTSQLDRKLKVHSVHRMQRRHSLTLGFRQEEENIDSFSQQGEDEIVFQQKIIQDTGREHLTQLSVLSDSVVLNLGDLASLLIPPKIVKSERIQRSTTCTRRCKKYSRRRTSCEF